jgi:hypothetical protein
MDDIYTSQSLVRDFGNLSDKTLHRLRKEGIVRCIEVDGKIRMNLDDAYAYATSPSRPKCCIKGHPSSTKTILPKKYWVREWERRAARIGHEKPWRKRMREQTKRPKREPRFITKGIVRDTRRVIEKLEPLFNLTPGSMKYGPQHKDISDARLICMTVLMERGYGIVEIAWAMNYADHTSVSKRTKTPLATWMRSTADDLKTEMKREDNDNPGRGVGVSLSKPVGHTDQDGR